ncbi:MAG: hypothetical protein RIC55_11630 [Pirellulaceae bacterium]
MQTPDRSPTFLEELETRQDDAIAQLDELNLRIEQLLRQWTGQRDADAGLEGRAASA